LEGIFEKDFSKEGAGVKNEPAAELRGCVAEALGRLGAAGKKTKELLHAVARDASESPNTRLQAAVALVRLGLSGPEEVLVVQFALASADAGRCALTIDQLRDLTPKQAADFLPALRDVLQRPEPDLRQAAWYALQHLERQKSPPGGVIRP
jgi:hypothetical protein